MGRENIEGSENFADFKWEENKRPKKMKDIFIWNQKIKKSK